MPKTLSRGRITPKSGDNEKLLAVNELQKLASSVYRAGPFRLSATGAGPAIVWTSDEIPEGALWAVTVYAQGQSVPLTESASFVRSGLFVRATGGAASQTGAIATTVTIRDNFQVIAIALSGNTVTATVSGFGVPYNWATWVEIRVSN